MVEVNKEKDKLMYVYGYIFITYWLKLQLNTSDVILYYKSELELEFFVKKKTKKIFTS